MCGYMSSCSGHGTCEDATGTCKCDAGFITADCSHAIEALNDEYLKSFSLNGT